MLQRGSQRIGLRNCIPLTSRSNKTALFECGTFFFSVVKFLCLPVEGMHPSVALNSSRSQSDEQHREKSQMMHQFAFLSNRLKEL